ncbi:thiamine diphosphokinase [Vagococcus teuberi]
MKKSVIVLAGSDKSLWPSMDIFDEASHIIGVDRGAYEGVRHGLSVDVAVGDFDSLSSEELSYVKEHVEKVTQYPAEKDETDTEIGISVASELSEDAKIILIGGTGGRIDHFLANLWLPLQDRFKSVATRLVIKDNQNTLSYFLPGDYTIEKEPDKKYLAYVCLTPMTHLSLYDAKYRLDAVDVMQPTSYASNEFVGKTTRFSFSSGIMCVIQSKDK